MPGEDADIFSESENCIDINVTIPIPKFVDGLFFGQLNCNSIWGKKDEIRHFLETEKLTVLCINESKLDDTTPSSFFEVPGYTLLRYDRPGREGGGSLLYIQDGFRFLPLNYEVAFPNEVEVNCIQIFPPFHKPIIIVLIYRPPIDTLKSSFIRSLESLLFHIEQDKIDSIIFGDFNIDLLTSDKFSSSLSSLTSSFGYKQLIDEPTRVTTNSATLLDHIYTTFPSKIKQSGVFSLTISDHRFTFCVLSYKKGKVPSKIISYRPLKDANWEAIGSYITKLNWDGVNCSKSSDENLETFENVVTFALDQFCPEIKKRIKGNSPSWMSPEILSLIDKRNSLKSQFDCEPTSEHLINYRKFRNYVANRVAKAKKEFYFQNFSKIDDSASVWKTYFKLSGCDIKKSTDIPFLNINNSFVSDNDKKAQALAESFIVPDNTPPETRFDLYTSLKRQGNIDNENYNPNVSIDNIYKSSSRMKWKSSPNDFIPVIALKNLLPHILMPLSILFTFFYHM